MPRLQPLAARLRGWEGASLRSIHESEHPADELFVYSPDLGGTDRPHLEAVSSPQRLLRPGSRGLASFSDVVRRRAPPRSLVRLWSFIHVTTLRTAAFAALAFVPSALAGDVSVPAGFNVETNAAPALVAGQLNDGSLLYSTGVFGAGELSLLVDGELVPFAAGFGSIAGVAQSPLTGELVVGDSFPGMLWLVDDLNDDGDALDAGETIPHPAPFPRPSTGGEYLPFDLAFAPGSNDLFMTYSTFGAATFEGGVFAIADDAFASFADGFGFAAGLLFVDDALYVADLNNTSFVGRVARLVDGNADGDALDAGELTEFATGLNGAGALVQDASGAFFLTGTFAPDFSSASVARLVDTDDDDVADIVDSAWATGFGFTGGLTLLEGSGGFVPGVEGNGALIVTDFAATTVPRTIRTAPLATTSLVGTISSFSTPEIVVGGTPGASAIWVLSLDVTGSTIKGIGDLCVGFTGTNIISPMLPIGLGEVSLTLLNLRNLSAVAGLDFGIQGFTFEEGRVGIGNAIFGVVDG